MQSMRSALQSMRFVLQSVRVQHDMRRSCKQACKEPSRMSCQASRLHAGLPVACK